MCGQPTGFEALVRWTHPELGSIAPAEFLPLAEQSGLIVPLGEFVLRTACLQAWEWEEAGLDDFRVSVNLSPQQFRSESIVATIETVLEATGLSRSRLEFEITQGTLMESEGTTMASLARLKGIGISVSLDDFGSGYSSLACLRQFSVDTVKIDHSFVRDIPTDAEHSAIASAIISMSKALGLRVIAEGVETEKQRAFLTEHGCDEMQGHLISPAVDAATICELFEKD